MPRKGRGGPRSGNPGQTYTNRTDLAADIQPIAAPAGQTYGKRGRQEAAQAVVPLPDLTATLGALPGLADPSARPDEPLTAGMPMGPGPGPASPAPQPGGAGVLRAMIAADPDPELFALLAEAERAP